STLYGFVTPTEQIQAYSCHLLDAVWPKNWNELIRWSLRSSPPFLEIGLSSPRIESTIRTQLSSKSVRIRMDWPRLLAYITGTVDQELLLRNEYLAAENRLLKAQIKPRLRLSDAERTTLAEIGHRLGRKALEEVAAVAKPDTILGWYRKLIA